MTPPITSPAPDRHALWVRATHGVVALVFFALLVSGVVILMAHPRLYWGEVGNDLTPALLELPISRNHQHGGWTNNASWFGDSRSPVSAIRTYEIFNQNSWGRSLHFLAAWFLVGTGTVYMLAGILTGHFRRHLVPRIFELTIRNLGQDIWNHLHLRIPPGTGGPHYGPLQKCIYLGVVFIALPMMLLSGLAMSPAVTAAAPGLLDLFGGFQSARTIHFAFTVALVLFLTVHVLMVVRSGFKRQMRAMTFGK